MIELNRSTVEQMIRASIEESQALNYIFNPILHKKMESLLERK